MNDLDPQQLYGQSSNNTIINRGVNTSSTQYRSHQRMNSVIFKENFDQERKRLIQVQMFSNNLGSEEFRKQMFVQSPVTPFTQKNTFSLYNDSKVNVKQSVALQNGLGLGGMLLKDLSSRSGYNPQRQALQMNQSMGVTRFSTRISGGQNMNLRFCKRPVSSY